MDEFLFSKIVGKQEYAVACKDKKVKNVVIPKEYNGLPVTAVSAIGFFRCENLKSVTIPQSVTYIGDCAFLECKNLKNVEIPDSVKHVGAYVFLQCDKIKEHVFEGGRYLGNKKNPRLIMTGVQDKNLVRYTISKDTKFLSMAFRYCWNLEEIVLPEGLIGVCERAFEGCEKLETLTIPKSVQKIGEGAFLHCHSLTHIVIPEGVTTIEDRAFCCCGNLRSITLPASLTVVKKNAFGECKKLIEVRYQGDEASWEKIKFDETGNGYVLQANRFYRGQDEKVFFTKNL